MPNYILKLILQIYNPDRKELLTELERDILRRWYMVADIQEVNYLTLLTDKFI